MMAHLALALLGVVAFGCTVILIGWIMLELPNYGLQLRTSVGAWAEFAYFVVAAGVPVQIAHVVLTRVENTVKDAGED